MIKSGFAFHRHHSVLMEYVTDYDRRVEIIKKNKPPEEQALRLRLFRLIPEDRLPIKLVKAWDAYSKAWDAYRKAWDAYRKASDACNKRENAYNIARGVHAPEINKLHEELCPDCPFNGKTIFPVEEV